MLKNYTTGSLEVTRPVEFAFKAETVILYEVGPNLQLNASLDKPDGIKLRVLLVVEAKEGDSKGTFTGDGSIPYTFYAKIESPNGKFYNSDSGTYAVNYNKASGIFTGTVNFTVETSEAPIEFAYTFDIPGTRQ